MSAVICLKSHLAFASNMASLPPSCAPSWPFTWLQLSTKIQFPQFLLSPWPTSSNAPYHVPLSPVLQLPHQPNQQPPTPVLLQFDEQPKPSGMLDLPVPAPHDYPPSSHGTPTTTTGLRGFKANHTNQLQQMPISKSMRAPNMGRRLDQLVQFNAL